MSAPLPPSVPVSGSDWFMLALDRAAQARIGHGNVCHLVVWLAGTLPVERVRARVAEVPELAWLASLRVGRAHPLAIPAWRASASAPFEVREHRVTQWEGAAESLFADVMDAFARTAVALDVIQGPDDRTALVLSWHHAMLDARGAELLLRRLAEPEGAPILVWDAPVAAATLPLGTRLLKAKVARDFVFRASIAAMDTLTRRGLPGRPTLHHRQVELVGEEVPRSDAAAQAAGAGVLRSAFVLACVARAVHGVLVARGEGRKGLLVPVPQDQRPRGRLGPILSNQLGVLFYRITPADLRDVPTAVRSLAEQLRAMLRADLPSAFALLLAMCRRLPLGLYLRLVQLPTWGRIASFGFSDAGDGLSRIPAVLGVPVARALHFPANVYPPGFTVVVSRTSDRVVVSTAWMQGTFSEAEVLHYERTLRAGLLGADDAG